MELRMVDSLEKTLTGGFDVELSVSGTCDMGTILKEEADGASEASALCYYVATRQGDDLVDVVLLVTGRDGYLAGCLATLDQPGIVRTSAFFDDYRIFYPGVRPGQWGLHIRKDPILMHEGGVI